MENILQINNESIIPGCDIDYYTLLDLCNIPRSKATNREQTLNYINKYMFKVKELKISKGKTKYRIILKIETDIPKYRSREFQKEKDYLLYVMLAESLEQRKGKGELNRIQKGGTAIAYSFGLLNKIHLNQFNKDDDDYKFIISHPKLFKELNKQLYGKKKNILNFIESNPNITMSKSFMLMKDKGVGYLPEFKRLDELKPDFDVLTFNYKEEIDHYCKTRKRELISDMYDKGLPQVDIDSFKNEKTFNDYNLYNYENENELLQEYLRKILLTDYNIDVSYDYTFVCVRNLIINNDSEYNTLLEGNYNIDKKLVLEYKRVLNKDVMNDLKKKFLNSEFCNGNRNTSNYRNYCKLLDICIKI